jgi:hypothetical protein
MTSYLVALLIDYQGPKQPVKDAMLHVIQGCPAGGETSDDDFLGLVKSECAFQQGALVQQASRRDGYPVDQIDFLVIYVLPGLLEQSPPLFKARDLWNKPLPVVLPVATATASVSAVPASSVASAAAAGGGRSSGAADSPSSGSASAVPTLSIEDLRARGAADIDVEYCFFAQLGIQYFLDQIFLNLETNKQRSALNPTGWFVTARRPNSCENEVQVFFAALDKTRRALPEGSKEESQYIVWRKDLACALDRLLASASERPRSLSSVVFERLQRAARRSIGRAVDWSLPFPTRLYTPEDVMIVFGRIFILFISPTHALSLTVMLASVSAVGPLLPGIKAGDDMLFHPDGDRLGFDCLECRSDSSDANSQGEKEGEVAPSAPGASATASDGRAVAGGASLLRICGDGSQSSSHVQGDAAAAPAPATTTTLRQGA